MVIFTPSLCYQSGSCVRNPTCLFIVSPELNYHRDSTRSVARPEGGTYPLLMVARNSSTTYDCRYAFLLPRPVHVHMYVIVFCSLSGFTIILFLICTVTHSVSIVPFGAAPHSSVATVASDLTRLLQRLPSRSLADKVNVSHEAAADRG